MATFQTNSRANEWSRGRMINREEEIGSENIFDRKCLLGHNTYFIGRRALLR
jgi:hypothetical protein